MGHNTTKTLLLLSGFLFFVVCGPCLTNGQPVVVKVDPQSFLPSVTPLVTLECYMTSGSTGSPTVLFMQLKKSALPDSTDEAASTSGQDGGSGDAGSHRRDSLIATVTPGSSAKLHVHDEENRFALDGGIDHGGSRISLQISRPQDTDTGLYLCIVSVLSSDFQLQELTGMANITVIDNEGSSSVLLAKEQILEKQQKHLEQEELALQDELEQALKTNSQLSDRVQNLEEKSENLTALVQSLMTTVTSVLSKSGETGDAARADSVAHTSEASLSELHDKLRDAQAKMNRLENVVVSALSSRIKTVETETLASIRKRLDSLEDKATSFAMEKELKRTESDTHQADHAKDNELRFQRVVDRLDQLEQQTVKEISDRLTHLKEDQVAVLEMRLDRVEGTTVKRLADKITAVDRMQADDEEKLEQFQTKVQQMETDIHSLKLRSEQQPTRPSPERLGPLKIPTAQEPEVKPAADSAQKTSGRSCYVCGNLSLSQPCSMEDLRAAKRQSCPVGASFCVNDIFQEAHSRSIYKRCVSEETCRSVHNAHSSKSCANFNFMSRGSFDCHYCCTSDLCNMDFKPSVDLLQN